MSEQPSGVEGTPTWRQYECDACHGIWLVQADAHAPRGCTFTNCNGRQEPMPIDRLAASMLKEAGEGTPERTIAEIHGESAINKAARRYMAESMGMCDVYDDQEQNFILGHLATFAFDLQQRVENLSHSLVAAIERANAAEAALSRLSQAQATQTGWLRTALREMTDDLKARWDMDDPHTNPGIRANVERADALLASPALAGAADPPDTK